MSKDFFKKENNIRLLFSTILFLLAGIGFFYLSNISKNQTISNVLNSIASVVVVSGIYNVIYEYILKKSMIDILIEKVELKRSIEETGLSYILLKTEEINFKKLIFRTLHSIDIVHAYGDTWTRNNIENIQEACSKRKIEVRVFLLAKESPFVSAIATHYNRRDDDMIKAIDVATRMWEDLRDKVGKFGSTVKIYYFHGNPAHSFYRFDNSIVCILNKIGNEFTQYLPSIICEGEGEEKSKLYGTFLTEINQLEKNYYENGVLNGKDL